MTHTNGPTPNPAPESVTANPVSPWYDNPADTWFEAQFREATHTVEVLLSGGGRVRPEGASFVSCSSLIEMLREFPEMLDFQDTCKLAAQAVNSEDFTQMRNLGRGIADMFVEEFSRGPDLPRPMVPELMLEYAAEALARKLQQGLKHEVWAADFAVDLVIHLGLAAE